MPTMTSSLESSLKYLTEKGVWTKQISPSKWVIGRHDDRATALSIHDDSYWFECWDHTPGPGEDDFLVSYACLDQLLLAVWCFYFGAPVTVAEWSISLHRRPDWSLDRLQYRLANAMHITDAGFDAAKEQRRLRAQMQPEFNSGKSRLALASVTQFIFAGIHTNTGEHLFIRRDMEEAYILPASRKVKGAPIGASPDQ